MLSSAPLKCYMSDDVSAVSAAPYKDKLCSLSLSEPAASLHLYGNRPFRLCWIIRTTIEVLPSSGQKSKRFKCLTADLRITQDKTNT